MVSFRISKQNCWAVTSPKKGMDEFVFLSWRLGNTWNLNFDFKFWVFPSHQDRKTNSFVCFLGEVTAQQFCFEIYCLYLWVLMRLPNSQLIKIDIKMVLTLLGQNYLGKRRLIEQIIKTLLPTVIKEFSDYYYKNRTILV